MAKTLTIEIRSMEQALEGFRKTFRALEGGGNVAHEGVSFTRIEAARNLLTKNRLALLRAVPTQRPGSIYDLAKTVKRDLKSVQQDLRVLEEYGLIRMTPARGAGN